MIIFHEDSDSEFFPPFSQRVDLTPFFLENSLIIVAVLVPVTVAFILLKRSLFYKTIVITDVERPDRLDENPPKELIRLACIVRALYRMLIFPLSAGFMLVLMLSCHIQSMSFLNSRSPTFPIILSSVAKLLVMLILSNVCSTEIFAKKSEFSELVGAKGWYIPLFLLRSLLISVLIFLGALFGFDTFLYWIIGIQTFYFMMVTFGRPYRKFRRKSSNVDNVGVVLI